MLRPHCLQSTTSRRAWCARGRSAPWTRTSDADRARCTAAATAVAPPSPPPLSRLASPPLGFFRTWSGTSRRGTVLQSPRIDWGTAGVLFPHCQSSGTKSRRAATPPPPTFPPLAAEADNAAARPARLPAPQCRVRSPVGRATAAAAAGAAPTACGLTSRPAPPTPPARPVTGPPTELQRPGDGRVLPLLTHAVVEDGVVRHRVVAMRGTLPAPPMPASAPTTADGRTLSCNTTCRRRLRCAAEGGWSEHIGLFPDAEHAWSCLQPRQFDPALGIRPE